MAEITSSVLKRIQQGEEINGPVVLQILGFEEIALDGIEVFKLHLSDGEFKHTKSYMSLELCSKEMKDSLVCHAIMAIYDYAVIRKDLQDFSLFIKRAEVVEPADQVHGLIGDPVSFMEETISVVKPVTKSISVQTDEHVCDCFKPEYTFTSLSDALTLPLGTYIDVIGVIKQIEDLGYGKTKWRGHFKTATVILIDEHEVEIPLHVYGDNAEDFEMMEVCKNDPTVLVIKDVQVSEYHGRRQLWLPAENPINWYSHSEIPEAERLKASVNRDLLVEGY